MLPTGKTSLTPKPPGEDAAVPRPPQAGHDGRDWIVAEGRRRHRAPQEGQDQVSSRTLPRCPFPSHWGRESGMTPTHSPCSGDAQPILPRSFLLRPPSVQLRPKGPPQEPRPRRGQRAPGAQQLRGPRAHNGQTQQLPGWRSGGRHSRGGSASGSPGRPPAVTGGAQRGPGRDWGPAEDSTTRPSREHGDQQI